MDTEENVHMKCGGHTWILKIGYGRGPKCMESTFKE